MDGRYRVFPDRFFTRADESSDDGFYAPVRLVTHLDDAAIAAVGALYDELGLRGTVLDVCSSWISHFRARRAWLVALGMNAAELEHNAQAAEWLVHDLNADPRLPFEAASFDAATCCVSVDYLVRPLEVFDEVARVLRPGAPFVCTFSNRCFPTKAIRGWLATDDEGHLEVVSTYFRASQGWSVPVAKRCIPAGQPGDPLYAVWARHETAIGAVRCHDAAQTRGTPGWIGVESIAGSQTTLCCGGQGRVRVPVAPGGVIWTRAGVTQGEATGISTQLSCVDARPAWWSTTRVTGP